jgi:hypothetical protein
MRLLIRTYHLENLRAWARRFRAMRETADLGYMLHAKLAADVGGDLHCFAVAVDKPPVVVAWHEQEGHYITLRPGEHTFRCRASPTSRLSKGRNGHAAGAEVDVGGFTDDPSAAYLDWFMASWERRMEGMLLGRVDVDSWTRSMALRRTQGAERRRDERPRPDVVFTGKLTIVDPIRAQATLLGGIGRNRSFGYGMVRLTDIERELVPMLGH